MFANRDIVALAPRWFGKIVSTASAPWLDKEETEWRQRQMEVGQEKSGAPKRTRALSAEELSVLLAQRCQQLERANGRLSESRIKNAGREIVGKDDRKECGRRFWFGPGAPALSALAPMAGEEHGLSTRGMKALQPPVSYMHEVMAAFGDPFDAHSNPDGYLCVPGPLEGRKTKKRR